MVRLDKWLWAARFFKTRTLGADDIAKGRVKVNGHVAKASRELKVGDRVELRQGPLVRELVVSVTSDQRGAAPIAQTLYVETPESVEARSRHALDRRMNTEPSLAIEQGRPTKRDRRRLVDWNRWSASVDPE